MPQNIDHPERWVVFKMDQLIIHDHDERQPFHTANSMRDSQFKREFYLGKHGDIAYYCAELADDAALPQAASIRTLSLRQAFEHFGDAWMPLLGKAHAIIQWDTNHQYCGRCGSPTKNILATFERYCDTCDFTNFPRLSPSIIVLISKGDQILMSRSPHFPPGIFGLIAGFVEAGETLEEAVHREVKEEVGIQVSNLRYTSSQYWPFPDSLMIGFTADYIAGDIQIDEREIESAGWYHYNDLPRSPSKISIASHMIDQFIAQKRG